LFVLAKPVFINFTQSKLVDSWPIAPTNNTAPLMIEPVYSITSAMRALFSNISTTENRAIETVDC